MAVLCYWRAEWTNIDDEDGTYKLIVADDLRMLIKKCFVQKLNIPNAARKIAVFMKNNIDL